ncbi:alpha-ketoglutarate dehydrogenase component 4 isoform X1 [Rhinoderma darwinii]|uniref:alpha-ketoglutarate dehydrogenase component 4 isoform X1 n=1 Tax=Rhinoderma darwinii TaxID=43563 RepID=UPI003F67D572
MWRRYRCSIAVTTARWPLISILHTADLLLWQRRQLSRDTATSCPVAEVPLGVAMGSKMAAASRVVQVVKPHVPIIRFPDRKNSPKPNVQEALKAMIYPFTVPPVTAHENPPGAENPAPVRKARGSPDTSDLLRSLPQKYRRKAVSVEEMDYIQRGGPE